jgi:hypothetical protein
MSKHVIMICGFARAGKDTFAKGLIAGATNRVHTLAFADSLKYALGAATKELDLDVNYMLTENKLQDRDLLVEFGRAMRRRDKDVFAHRIRNVIANCEADLTWVITDWRYLNEYSLISHACEKHGYTLHTVHIERHGWEAANEEERINLEEVVGRAPIDVFIKATSGDEESVLLAGIRTAKLWNL